MPSILDVLAEGTLDARPAASPTNRGFYYYANDDTGGTLYQSTGTDWQPLAPGRGAFLPGMLVPNTTNQAGDYTIPDVGYLVQMLVPDSTATLPDAAGNGGKCVVVINQCGTPTDVIKVAPPGDNLLDGTGPERQNTLIGLGTKALYVASSDVTWHTLSLVTLAGITHT